MNKYYKQRWDYETYPTLTTNGQDKKNPSITSKLAISWSFHGETTRRVFKPGFVVHWTELIRDYRNHPSQQPSSSHPLTTTIPTIFFSGYVKTRLYPKLCLQHHFSAKFYPVTHSGERGKSGNKPRPTVETHSAQQARNSIFQKSLST